MPEDPRSRRRLQTATERDTASAEARKLREQRERSAGGYDENQDPITGVLSGEDLRAARARRLPEERLERLEDKADELVLRIDNKVDELSKRSDVRHDDLSKRVGNMEVAMGDVSGQMKILPSLVDTMKEAISNFNKRDHVTLSAKVEVEKAVALDQVAAGADLRKDELAARKEKRKRTTKIITGVLAILTSGAVIGWVIARFG